MYTNILQKIREKGEKRLKKSTFVITQTILSIILAASVGAVVVLTLDIRSGGKILPQELFNQQTSEKSKSAPKETSEKNNPAESSVKETTSKVKESSVQESVGVNSKPQSSAENLSETSAKEESEKENSKSEESKVSADELKLILTEPKDLKTNPKELTKFINDYGYGYDSLGFNHMIIVDVEPESSAKVYCYQKSSKDYWWNIAGDNKPITDKAFIGSNGADFDVKTGSKKSPLGFYYVGEGFYIGDEPDTTFPVFEITDKTYWVTDTKSKSYNKHVEETDDKDWSDAIQMISDKDAYKYGLVIDFNTTSPDKKLASAIFMHCGNAPTDGSIVVPENVMKSILEWLDSDSNTYIFVSP